MFIVNNDCLLSFILINPHFIKVIICELIDNISASSIKHIIRIVWGYYMAPRMLVNPTQASTHYFLQRKKFLVLGIVSKQMLNEMLRNTACSTNIYTSNVLTCRLFFAVICWKMTSFWHKVFPQHNCNYIALKYSFILY